MDISEIVSLPRQYREVRELIQSKEAEIGEKLSGLCSGLDVADSDEGTYFVFSMVNGKSFAIHGVTLYHFKFTPPIELSRNDLIYELSMLGKPTFRMKSSHAFPKLEIDFTSESMNLEKVTN